MHRTRGFTLIELLVVVVIISILMAILLPAINSVRLSAQRAEVRTTITNLENALKMYQTDNGVFPPSEGETGIADITLSIPAAKTTSNPAGNVTFSDGSLVRFLDGRASNDDVSNPTRPPIQYFEFPDERVIDSTENIFAGSPGDAQHPVFVSLFQSRFFYGELQSKNLLDSFGDASGEADPDGDPATNIFSNTFRTFQIFCSAEVIDDTSDADYQAQVDRIVTNSRNP